MGILAASDILHRHLNSIRIQHRLSGEDAVLELRAFSPLAGGLVARIMDSVRRPCVRASASH